MPSKYEPLTWIDRIEDAVTGEVIRYGTDYCARHMNHIEQGIAQAWNALETVGGAVTREITIPVDEWITDTLNLEDWEKFNDTMAYKDVPVDGVTDSLIPLILLNPADKPTADSCGLKESTRTLEGVIRFYADRKPDKEIAATAVLISTGGGIPTFNYDLPIATKSSLGTVMIGDGIDVTETGLISTDAEAEIAKSLATDEEIDALKKELFPEDE